MQLDTRRRAFSPVPSFGLASVWPRCSSNYFTRACWCCRCVEMSANDTITESSCVARALTGVVRGAIAAAVAVAVAFVRWHQSNACLTVLLVAPCVATQATGVAIAAVTAGVVVAWKGPSARAFVGRRVGSTLWPGVLAWLTKGRNLVLLLCVVHAGVSPLAYAKQLFGTLAVSAGASQRILPAQLLTPRCVVSRRCSPLVP